MKKTLVAIAALASVTAFAQTSVVLDGFIDRGYLATNSTLDTSDTKPLHLTLVPQLLVSKFVKILVAV